MPDKQKFPVVNAGRNVASKILRQTLPSFLAVCNMICLQASLDLSFVTFLNCSASRPETFLRTVADRVLQGVTLLTKSVLDARQTHSAQRLQPVREVKKAIFFKGQFLLVEKC